MILQGLIQSVFELHDGSGIVVTVGKYVTPNHKDINGDGIEPDYRRLPGAIHVHQIFLLLHPTCNVVYCSAEFTFVTDLNEARDYLMRCQSKKLN